MQNRKNKHGQIGIEKDFTEQINHEILRTGLFHYKKIILAIPYNPIIRNRFGSNFQLHERSNSC